MRSKMCANISDAVDAVDAWDAWDAWDADAVDAVPKAEARTLRARVFMCGLYTFFQPFQFKLKFSGACET
jgi:hypothetical protein